MASITLENVSRTFPSGDVAVRDLSLHIESGELLVLVGPSGSGKSTVLRLIAGLDETSSGRVLIGDEDVTDVPPQARDLAMVFQSYALYPHMTVRQNMEFGLRMRGAAQVDMGARVQQTADMLGIGALLDRRPSQLSGGQRQRVALGRALVREARAYLLDEPLSNLDPLLRVETRSELSLLHRRLGATMVYVTHDQEEAMTLGTRIAVMRQGVLEQVGAPLELYRRPANRFVARFIGTPAMNVWRAADGADVGVRPQDIELCGEGGRADGSGLLELAEPLGPATVLHVRVPVSGDGIGGNLAPIQPELIRIVAPAEAPVSIGGEVRYRFRPDRVHRFEAATGLRTEAGRTLGDERAPA